MLIAHVELRDEESPDIRPYQHERKVEKIVVKLGQEITSVRDKYLKVFNLLHLGHYEIIGQARLLNHVTVTGLGRSIRSIGSIAPIRSIADQSIYAN